MASHCCPLLVEMLLAVQQLYIAYIVIYCYLYSFYVVIFKVAQNFPFHEIPNATEAQINSYMLQFHPQQTGCSCLWAFAYLFLFFHSAHCYYRSACKSLKKPYTVKSNHKQLKIRAHEIYRNSFHSCKINF